MTKLLLATSAALLDRRSPALAETRAVDEGP